MIDQRADAALARLLERMRCPDCGASLLRLDDRTIACAACDARAEVRSRAPLAVSWSPSDSTGAARTFRPPAAAQGWRARLWRWHNRTESRALPRMLVLPDSRLEEIRTAYAAQPAALTSILDVGGGKGRWRELLGHPDDYTSVDLLDPGEIPVQPGVTYVQARSESLPFADGSFGTALAMELLEHVPEPGRAVSEIARVALPGALVVASTRQAWRTHSAPTDFFRYTRYGLAHLFGAAGLEVEQLLPLGGPASVVAITIDNNVPALMKPGLRQLVGHPLWRLAAWLDRTAFRENLAGDNPETAGWLVFARKRET